MTVTHEETELVKDFCILFQDENYSDAGGKQTSYIGCDTRVYELSKNDPTGIEVCCEKGEKET